MKGHFHQGVRAFYRDLPNWLLMVAFLLVLVPPLIGFSWGSPPSTTTAQFFLSALASAQAAVLAIVFAVAILGIQLVATRYAPRSVSMFTKSSVFLFTFGVFIGSIAVSLSLLYWTPQHLPRIFTSGIFLAGGMGILATFSLYAFIGDATKRSTPDGIISSIDRSLTTAEYQRQTMLCLRHEHRPPHPMHLLYSVAILSLSNKDHVSAESATASIERIANRTIDNLDWNTVDPSKEESVKLFEPVLEDYLPEIAIYAAENDEFGISNQAIDAIETVGKSGIDTIDELVAQQAGNGLIQVLRDAERFHSDYRIVSRSIHNYGDLLEEVSDKPAPRSTSQMTGRIDHWGEVILFRREYDSETYYYRELTLELFRTLSTVQSNLLKHYAEPLQDEQIDWHSRPGDVPEELAEPIRAIHKNRKAIVSLNNHILVRYSRTGEYPIVKGNYGYLWTSCCHSAIDSGLRELGVKLVTNMIEVAYAATIVNENERGFWSRKIAEVATQADSDPVWMAFRRIESAEEGYSREIVGGSTDRLNASEGAVGRILQKLQNDSSFQQWTQRLREDVEKKVSVLSGQE